MLYSDVTEYSFEKKQSRENVIATKGESTWW